MIENLTLFDICNSKAKAKVVELLLTCNNLTNCPCRFCTGEYWKVQKELSLLSDCDNKVRK